MDWEPITETEILDMINKSYDRMTPEQRRIWKTIKIKPPKTGIYARHYKEPPDGKLISPNLLAKIFIASLVLVSLFYMITHPKKAENKEAKADQSYNYNACPGLNSNTLYCKSQREESARFQRLIDQNLKED